MLESKDLKVEVINSHTIKPLDEKTIIKSAKKTKLIFNFNLYRFIMQMIRDPYNTDSNPSHFDRRIGLTDL